MEGEICGKTPRHPSHGWLPAACVRNVLRAPSPAGSVSSPSQARPGALAPCTTASFPQEPGSVPLDMHSPFLLGLSLLTIPFSERMDQVASTGGTASDCKTQPRMRCYLPIGVVSRKGQAYDGKERAFLCSTHQCLTGRVSAARSLLSPSRPDT